MKTLNLSHSHKTRTDAKGTTWHHFECPFCLRRGAGKDRGHHLGVGVKPSGHVWLKCFRCGMSGSLRDHPEVQLRGLKVGLSKTGEAYRRSRFPAGGRGQGAGSSSGSSWSSLSHRPDPSVLQRKALRLALSHWKGVTEADLLVAGGGVTPDSIGTLVMPYKQVQGKETGVQYRRFLDPDLTVLTEGPKGPATYLSVHIGEEDRVLVVEAWADGLTAPDGVKPMFLLGTSGLTLPKIRCAEFIICLDGDAPGRRMARAGASCLMKKQRRVSVITLPDGTDPADHTEDEMSVYVDTRKMLCTASDLRAAFSD